MKRATFVFPFALALGASLVSTEARADQCAYISFEEAERAVALLSEGQRIVEFCEPCGETQPELPYAVRTVEHRDVDYEGYREVYVNDAPLDLAYVFAETAPGRFENLAKRSGCHATGVSPVLELTPPPASPPEPEPDCPEVERPSPDVSQPVIHVHLRDTRSAEVTDGDQAPGWRSFLLGGLLLAPAWAGVWFGLWLLRRRRA